MAGIRKEKYASLIQKELGEYFIRDGATINPGTMVTVTVVRVTPDLGLAKVYLSFFGKLDKKEALSNVKDAKHEIRHELAKKIGKQVRVIPELNFYVDDSLDYAEEVDNLLNKD